ADVTWMQDHGRDAAGERLPMQQRLDRRLADAVLAVGRARLVLRHWYARRPSVHPDGAAVDEQRTRRPECVDEAPGGRGGGADQGDDRVGPKGGNPAPEPPGEFLGVAVGVHTPYRRPFDGLVVRLTLAAADHDDLVPGADQTGHEVAADVPRPSDHDDTA